MRITRRGWIGFICGIPFLSNLPQNGFAAQPAATKKLYRMNRFYIAGFQFYDEELYYEDPLPL